MTAAVLTPMVVGDPMRYAALAGALAVLVGAACFLAGIARLGFLANLLSRPVLVGYTAGIAVVMIASQLERLTGIPVKGEEFVEQIRNFAAGVGQAHWPTVALEAAVLAALLAIARWLPRAPGALIAVLAATAIVSLFSLDSNGIAVVGQIPSGLPTPGLLHISAHDLALLVIPACGIAIVAFSDNILAARTFAARRGEAVDANAELRALGVCNAAAVVTQGFPVSSSGSRTPLGDAVGSRTQLFSLIMLAVVVLVMLFGRGVLALFPKAVLGALIVYAALRLIDVQAFRRLARFRRSELILACSTTAAVLAFRCAVRGAGRGGAVDSRPAAPRRARPRQRARFRARLARHARPR